MDLSGESLNVELEDVRLAGSFRDETLGKRAHFSMLHALTYKMGIMLLL